MKIFSLYNVGDSLKLKCEFETLCVFNIDATDARKPIFSFSFKNCEL